jgi:hypothetical protein
MLDEKMMTMAIAAVSVLIMMLLVYYVARRGDGFVSADGVVARRGQRQKRDDPGVVGSRDWNLAELEKSVALINRAS